MSDFITVAELRIEAERLCDENERLEAENAELRHDLEEASNQAEEVCIENAKLREELADAPKCETCEAMLDCDECLRADCSHKERRRLSAENAKLRELVRDMNKWLWNGADCTECPFTAECDLNAAFESDLHSHVCIGWSEIHDRMRELGVDE